jgi:exopolyphosphatase / guanosine-5'-triphosphate,3'-diphosphate pyrophosphatase
LETEKFLSLLGRYIENRRDVVGRLKQLVPDSIHTVIPGLVILHTVVTMVNSIYIRVREAGVREGYIQQKLFLCREFPIIKT